MRQSTFSHRQLIANPHEHFFASTTENCPANLTELTNTFDLQKYFTKLWNQTHPYTSDCLARHQPVIDECISEDVLACLVNSDDINDEIQYGHWKKQLNSFSAKL
ncbi:unnamed protein product [Rotaria magnacalcarata]|uniref:Uncharacterized protein n=2 Tax=Rotaria magnacalcarata TaxID=392030 RepID=A0A8S2QYY9_9BILA|nr:unnamed protein product [Rotaria magnacalcarata]